MAKNTIYSFINITGLAIGLASALIILLYIQEELSYDKFNDKSDRIYRVYIEGKIGGDELKAATSCAPIGATMVQDYPEVVNATRLFVFGGKPVVKYGGKSFVVDRFYYADSTFFDVFTVKFLRGNPENALNKVKTLVITGEMAKKLFGKEDPLGKSIKVGNNQTDYEITGVVEKFPRNSHIHFDMLASGVTREDMRNSTIWLSNNYLTYILIQKGFPVEKLEAKMPEMIKKYAGPQFLLFSNATFDEFLKSGGRYGYKLQPLTDIHLHSDLQFEVEPGGSIKSIYIFSIIAFFLILIASINFMNLATARSITRAREVGLRKVVGSTRSQLIWQFLIESVLISFIALLIAMVIIEVLLPWFNNFTGKQLDTLFKGNWTFLLYLLIFGLGVGFLSGIYPAFYLSSFRPLSVLKGKLQTGVKGGYLRSILVIFQFIITIFLIISTMTVWKQMQYIRHKDLGFNKDNLLVIDRAWALKDQRSVFEEELLKNPAIQMVSQTNNMPSYLTGNTAFHAENSGPEGIRATNFYYVDENFQKTLGLQLKEGRWFSKDIAGDSTAVVLNEAAVKAYGYTDPIDKNIMQLGAGPDTSDLAMRIIGVVKDFHYESLHQAIQPLIIMYNRGRFASYFAVRIQAGTYRNTMAFIKEQWNKMVQDQPIEYTFLDDALSKNYQEDKNSGTLFALFALLAIFISSLGLMGLASFTTEKRTKEIGVRKVMGASVYTIIKLLNREIVILILISSAIAWPVSYYFMNKWLQNFAFHEKLSFPLFIFASLAAFIVALFTVSWQTYKAAVANPAKSLRYE